MSLYRVEFVQQGPMTERPSAQAIFGSFCHAYKSEYGNDELESFLSAIRDHRETFAVSSMYLRDTLPFPLDVEPKRVEIDTLNKESFIKFKRLKKVRFLSKRLFETYRDDKERFNETFYRFWFSGTYAFVDDHQLLCHKDEISDYESILVKRHVATRNRWSLDDDEKKLFYTSRLIYSKDTRFDVYLLISDERLEHFERVFKKLAYFSFGGKQSIGMNLYKYKNLEPVSFQPTTHRTLLSKAFVDPKEIDVESALYKVSMLEAVFDNSVVEKRYRKPVVVFDEGSVIPASEATIGRLVADRVADHDVYQNAIGLLV